MEASVVPAASVEAKDELIKSLTTFLQRYNQHEARFHQASERFAQEAADARRRLEDSESGVLALVSLSGGCVGASVGAVTGGLFGAFGAVTCSMLSEDITTSDILLGLLGGVFGGMLGGAFSGALGGLFTPLTKTTRNPVHKLNTVLWLSTGFVSGGVIGVILGGSVGAAGGAIGAGLGSMYATDAANYLDKVVADFFETSESHKGGKQLGKRNEMQKAGEECSGSLVPLVEELRSIQALSDQMAPSEATRSVAEQTTATLAAARQMQEGVRESQAAANLPQFVSCAEEASARSKKMLEGLERTRAGVEKLLVFLGGEDLKTSSLSHLSLW